MLLTPAPVCMYVTECCTFPSTGSYSWCSSTDSATARGVFLSFFVSVGRATLNKHKNTQGSWLAVHSHLACRHRQARGTTCLECSDHRTCCRAQCKQAQVAAASYWPVPVVLGAWSDVPPGALAGEELPSGDGLDWAASGTTVRMAGRVCHQCTTHGER